MTPVPDRPSRGIGRPVPPPRLTARREVALALGLLVVTLQLGVLVVLGRDWGCGCERTRIWGGLSAEASSRHWTDPYTALHLGFGMALLLLFSRLRPRWRVRDWTLLALVSHAVWEVVENLPMIAARFHSAAAGLPYRGDSLANSLGDTIFALLGGALALRLTAPAILAGVVVLELAVTLAIGDGYALGLLRAAGIME